MNVLEFFSIIEQDRDILNPVSPEKLQRVAAYAGLRAGLSVLDIGSGKAAMLRQWARQWDIRGTGLELNPAFMRDARASARRQGVADRLTFWEGRVLDFLPDVNGYDVVTCLGAPFVIGSFLDAVNWMCQRLRSGGSLVIGDVYLKQAVSDEELERHGWKGLPTLEARCAELQSVGLELVGLTVAAEDDWDHYSSLMWSAVVRWAAENPAHPDRAEILKETHESRARSLAWERAHVGWAVLVGRRDD